MKLSRNTESQTFEEFKKRRTINRGWKKIKNGNLLLFVCLIPTGI